MNNRLLTVIDVARAIRDTNRVGRDAGVTAVAKQLGITIPRTRRMLDAAIRVGMVYGHRQRYRENVDRTAYSLHIAGIKVLEVLGDIAPNEMQLMLDGFFIEPGDDVPIVEKAEIE